MGVIAYVQGLPIHDVRTGTAHDPATGQFTSSGDGHNATEHAIKKYPSVDPTALAAEGWHLTDYHKIWLKEGTAKLVRIPVKDLVHAYREDHQEVVDAHKSRGHAKVKGILQDWADGYRHPVVDAFVNEDHKVQISDGRHRTAAAIIQGRHSIPVVVGIK